MERGKGPDRTRRRALAVLAGAAAGSAVFGRSLLAAAASGEPITMERVRQAEWVAGVSYTDEQRKLMLDGIRDLERDFERLRAVLLDNATPPAVLFAPDPLHRGRARPFRRRAEPVEKAAPERTSSTVDLAFAPVSELAALIRTRRVSSSELTRLYLERLDRFDPLLHCVITRTDELAVRQAERADREIAAGRYRGPLHGIPWGAKDLLSVPGYPTTWGAAPYRKQVRDETATVAARLEEAGAVLAAKLSMGALAWGDVWFGGKTRNPWNPEKGSSGSSAGPASAAAAGLVGFAIGTETWGSIVSPCTVCGCTGLRPTFGRVSRYGAMALSWSMDKIGPIARTVEDCALVFDAIHGADGLDPTATDRPFRWPPGRDVRSLRVGFVQDLFEKDRSGEAKSEEERRAAREWMENDRRTLHEIKEMGVELIPLHLPSSYPVDALALILTAEAATAFDHLTRTGRDAELVRQEKDAWPNVFRQGQLIPAVEYLRANRIRTLVMAETETALRDLDAYVAPCWVGDHLLRTNLTGHPCVVVPNGFRSDGLPTGITFCGPLHRDADVLALAHAYQQATGYHLRRPPLADGDRPAGGGGQEGSS